LSRCPARWPALTGTRGADQGKDWVDSAQLFDPVNHDLLMGRIAPVIRDKRGLRLRGKTAGPVVWEGGRAQSRSPDPIHRRRQKAKRRQAWRPTLRCRGSGG